MHIRIQAWVLIAVLSCASACSPKGDSGHAHGHAPEHQDHGHGHTEDERSLQSATHFSSQTELYAEYPALVLGQDSRMLAHFTMLSDFSAVPSGIVEVTLSQQGQVTAGFRVREPWRAGLFAPVITPSSAGQFDLAVRLKTDQLDITHELGSVTVHAEPDHVPDSSQAAHAGIEYLKEQQWQGEFELALVAERRIELSVPAAATILAASDRQALLRAGSAGIVGTSGEPFPKLGQQVSQGQTLALLRPQLSTGTDLATLDLDLQRAGAEEKLARENLNRLRGLLASGAVPRYRVTEAEKALEVARAEQRAAQSRRARLGTASTRSDLAIIAPISGGITELSVRPGAVVSVDEPLMQIVGAGGLWLRAEVAEVDADLIDEPAGAWFDLPSGPQRLRVGENASLVSVGGVIDPVRRTLPVIFEFDPEPGLLRINQRLMSRVATRAAEKRLAIPRTALIDDAGQSVVFVQINGESFERRAVKTGARDARHVAVLHGLTAGERVVSRGAYDVYLASIDPAEAGHGHAH